VGAFGSYDGAGGLAFVWSQIERQNLLGTKEGAVCTAMHNPNTLRPLRRPDLFW
jgi:hypothetical protein